MKYAIILVLALFPVFAPAEESAIRIGAIASLTGAAAEQGENWLRGAELAVAELRQQGLSVKLIVEDDGTNPAQVASAFKKLVDLDRVQAIIGGTWDYLGETAYPLAKQYQIPFITPTNPVEALSESAKANPYVFTNGLSIRAERDAIREFVKHEKIGSVGVLFPNLPFGEVHAQIFDTLQSEGTVKVVFRETFDYNSTYQDNLKVAALKLKSTQADLVYAVLDVGGINSFLREFRRLKFHTKFLTTQHLQQAYELSRDTALFGGAFAVYPVLGAEQFREAYRHKFGSDPRVFSAHGYDAAKFLAGGLATGISFADPEAEFLYAGVTGEHKLPAVMRGLVKDLAEIYTTEGGSFKRYGESERRS